MTQEPSIYKPLLHRDGHPGAAFFGKEDAVVTDLSSIVAEDIRNRIRYSSSTKNVLGEGWIGEEAVASAMYCCWRSPDDYSAAVLTAMNTDGDSDYLHALGKRLWQKCGSRFP